MEPATAPHGLCFVRDCRGCAPKRESFFLLARKTFGIDFESWYQQGCWQPGSYIPYLLCEGERAVANVSASPMEMEFCGERKRLVQLGTVMTDPAWRGKGLSRFLMERVISEWEGRCEGIFLYANDRVLGYYPRFGFQPAREYEWYDPRPPRSEPDALRKLDLKNAGDRKLLEDALRSAVPCARVAQREGVGLAMFYALSAYRESIWLHSEKGAVLFAGRDGDALEVAGVYCPSPEPLPSLYAPLVDVTVREVRLGFAPLRAEGFACRPLRMEDTTLFVRGPVARAFGGEKLRFPLLSHT